MVLLTNDTVVNALQRSAYPAPIHRHVQRAETRLASGRWSVMLEQPTTDELARLLLRQIYVASDGGSRAVRLVANSTKAKAALEFANDKDWVVIEEDYEVRLTDTGRAVVKRRFS